jgi:translation initiation factor 2A
MLSHRALHFTRICTGFGNLAGEMDFWDMAKLRKLGSNAAHTAVEFGWSPDGRYFMTATCAPRMNVRTHPVVNQALTLLFQMDNGVKVFKYNGVGPVIERAVDRFCFHGNGA